MCLYVSWLQSSSDIAAPRLADPIDVYNVTEGSDFSLDLEYITPFPPNKYPLTSTWLLSADDLNDSRIRVGEYNISIMSVWRDLSGLDFNLTVVTSLGSDSKTFKLNVQCKFAIYYR